MHTCILYTDCDRHSTCAGFSVFGETVLRLLRLQAQANKCQICGSINVKYVRIWACCCCLFINSTQPPNLECKTTLFLPKFGIHLSRARRAAGGPVPACRGFTRRACRGSVRLCTKVVFHQKNGVEPQLWVVFSPPLAHP